MKDCYAALGIIHQTWSPVPGRIKDFIAMPRPNGYQSLHTSVVSERGFPFEVQIRTAEMHRIAEEGIAAHWKYKEGRVGADRDEQHFIWLRQLLEWQQEVRDPQEFLQNLKIELYAEEVYIFTPKGEVKALPRDATPIDFAYAIHTDVGHQCVGARVNGKMVPLRTRLRNGDIVEIVTTPGHKPSRDWLNIVGDVAGAEQDQALHPRRREGQEHRARTQAVREGGAPLRAEHEDARRRSTLRRAWPTELGMSKPEELFAAIGYGKLAAKALLAKLVPQDQLKETPETPIGIASVVRRVLGTGDEKIKVRGFDDLMVFRARCCNPIRGEKIVGYITRGKGVSVHSAACTNVVNLLYDPERRIEVEWDKGTDAAPYTVRLSIQVEDRKGILADVSSKIAGINTNIRNVEATVDSQMGRIDMTVEISDVKHLQKVIKSLKSVEGVVDVERAAR